MKPELGEYPEFPELNIVDLLYFHILIFFSRVSKLVMLDLFIGSSIFL